MIRVATTAASRSFGRCASRSTIALLGPRASPNAAAMGWSNQSLPDASSSSMWFRSFSDQNNNDSSGSHSDFAPQKKKIQDNSLQNVLDMIDSHVKENTVMLYMKGSPGMPQCGFSARVVQVLKSTGVDFASVNVLDYPSIREGVKQYSQWPTIPQLYVQGEFLGGCDIVEQMHESGELEPLLKEALAAKNDDKGDKDKAKE